MSWLDRLALRPRRRRREVDTEIEAHLELRVRQLTGAGMEERAARREALRRFGNLDTARQRLYASAKRRDQRLRRASRLEAVGSDLRSGLRRLRREPAAAALSVANLDPALRRDHDVRGLQVSMNHALFMRRF